MRNYYENSATMQGFDSSNPKDECICEGLDKSSPYLVLLGVLVPWDVPGLKPCQSNQLRGIGNVNCSYDI